ncbi:regulator of nonsense transcripts 2-like [Daphnia magna]|uniref:regulator of nonsense transcripts 2-like n=1 Tax=Daphnia magna TaxID=35525 RepID=UPI001E1BA0D1|nr:regulator of nonsense transcripts 2-like [Daphnia magna]
MSSKKSSYLDSIHILFKVKSTGDYTVGTAGMISLPKLPLENLVLLDKIQSLMDSKAEIKIRLENLNGKRQVLVATIHEFSKKPTGRSEMEKLRTQMDASGEISNKIDEEEKKRADEQAKKMAEEEAKKKAEEQAKKKANEQAKKKAEEETKKKAEEQAKKKAEEQAKKKAEEQEKKEAEEQAKKEAEEASLKKKADTVKNNSHMPVAKKRLTYYNEDLNEESDAGTQKDLFEESSDESDHENSTDGSNVADRQNIDDDEDSLYHKPSSGVSESNTLASLSSSTILTALENTAEENCGSVLVNNHSTPSRHQQMLDMKNRISDLESENGFLYHKVDEKDEEIESLKADILQLQSKNPDNLVERITAVLSAVNGSTRVSVNEDNTAATHNVSRHSTSREHVMVQLVQGHNLRIEKSDLKCAITIGRLSSGNLHLMVNKIMESIYTRVFMSNHTLTGMAPRAKKVGNTPPTPVKPGLPREDVLAITRKFFFAWKVYHNQVIKPKDVRVAIRSKLSTETRAILAINTTDLEPGVNTIDEANEDSAN